MANQECIPEIKHADNPYSYEVVWTVSVHKTNR